MTRTPDICKSNYLGKPVFRKDKLESDTSDYLTVIRTWKHFTWIYFWKEKEDGSWESVSGFTASFHANKWKEILNGQ